VWDRARFWDVLGVVVRQADNLRLHTIQWLISLSLVAIATPATAAPVAPLRVGDLLQSANIVVGGTLIGVSDLGATSIVTGVLRPIRKRP
jgi:hypothetical protein